MRAVRYWSIVCALGIGTAIPSSAGGPLRRSEWGAGAPPRNTVDRILEARTPYALGPPSQAHSLREYGGPESLALRPNVSVGDVRTKLINGLPTNAGDPPILNCGGQRIELTGSGIGYYDSTPNPVWSILIWQGRACSVVLPD